MSSKYDVIVVGGGVLGTFHAYHALKKGLKVAILEKDNKPQGATIQNFGQVVPSGMDTKWQTYGRESLRIYKEIQQKFDISVRNEGSIYIASNEEEVQLLEELCVINKANDYTSKLLTKKECLERYPKLRSDYVKAALFFPDEVMVEPRLMIHKLHAHLKTSGIDIYYNKTVIACDTTANQVNVHTTDNTIISSEKVIVCNGSDFSSLYPSLFAESDLVVSKLQMMQTKPQPNFRLPSSILTGESIRRYEAFAECPSYAAVKAKEDENSLVKKWGIHILFKQALDGSVIIGDSHEYADAKVVNELDNMLNMDIDNFIIAEAKKIFDLPTYDIQNRWYGRYCQCKTSDIYQHTIENKIHIVTGIGGKGMTGSAGFAKENINTIL